MTVPYDNGFDLLADGAVASTSSIASSGYPFHVGGSGTAHGSAADAIDGARAIELVRASNTLQVYLNNALSTTDISWSVMFTYKGSIPNANDYLWDVVAGGSLVRCLTNSAGHPFIQLNAATVYTGAGAAFTAGTQYRVDFRVHISATVGTIHADFYTRYGTTPLFTGCSLTGQNTGTTSITDVLAGPYGGNTVTVGTFVLDRVRGDDTQSTTYLGAPSTGVTATIAFSQGSTLGAAPTTTHNPSATFSQSSTMSATSGSGGPAWDDPRYAWDSPAIAWDGATSSTAARAAFSQASTLGAVPLDVPVVHPVPGIWRMTITKPYGALITITVGGP